MKKILAVAVSVICSMGLYAQSKPVDCPIRVSIALGTGISMTEPSANPLLLSLDGSYGVSKHLSVGLATGYSLYDKKSLIPLGINGRLTMRPNAALNPFVSCTAGYSFAPESSVNGGFLFSPSLGVQYSLWDKLFFFSLGYELQELERRKVATNSFFTARFVEALSYHSITVKLGMRF